MIQRFYKWFHFVTSRPDEAGEYSAGYWQDKVRSSSLDLCKYKNGKLLELGCGEGLFLAKLGLSNPSVQIWGVDTRDAMLKEAEKRIAENGIKTINLQHGDAIALPFGNSFFDTVVCVNVLFNMASINVINTALREMSRVCAPGGSIIFDYRNSLNWLLRLKYSLARYYDPSVRDLPLTMCRSEEIEPLLRGMNFEVKRKISVSFPKGRFTPIILLEAIKLK